MPLTYVKRKGPLGTAVFSPNYKYRYVLTRGHSAAPRPVWVMLNPSIADGSRDDHTITKCMGFSQRWGFEGIFVVNLFAYRSTDPQALHEVRDPVGLMNDAWLKRASKYSQAYDVPVIAAWGNNGPMERIEVVLPLFKDVYCLGLTEKMQPKHPLRLAYETPLQKWLTV